MIRELFPTIGDVVSALFWLGLYLFLRHVHRTEPRQGATTPPTLPPPELPPGFRVLAPGPFDWQRENDL